MTIRILLVTGASHDEHYRTCARLTTPEDLEVYVQVKYDHQDTCEHYFTDLNRFGDGYCQRCGAQGWSPYWVADGVFATNTDGYIERLLACYREQVKDLVLPRPVVALLADLDESAPAMLVGRRGAVPAMPLGVLEVQG